jgi:RluA family pseudouridine synthase
MLAILYQDEAMVAVAKPPGRIVVPGRGGAAQEVPLRDELAEQLGQQIFVVHRLDRGTSGALLFALQAEAHRALSLAFEHHRVDKRYWALCRGALFGAGEVDRALVPIRAGKVRPAGEGERGGKPSRTAWRALERVGTFSAVEFRPRSGRLHQVRAHAAVLGHPLAVDPEYGGGQRLTAADLDPGQAALPAGDQVVVSRLTLHAASLRLYHPLTAAPLEISAPLAPDLERALVIIRAGTLGGSL